MKLWFGLGFQEMREIGFMVSGIWVNYKDSGFRIVGDLTAISIQGLRVGSDWVDTNSEGVRNEFQGLVATGLCFDGFSRFGLGFYQLQQGYWVCGVGCKTLTLINCVLV